MSRGLVGSPTTSSKGKPHGKESHRDSHEPPEDRNFPHFDLCNTCTCTLFEKSREILSHCHNHYHRTRLAVLGALASCRYAEAYPCRKPSVRRL
jgi:hypothetical protein